MPNKYLVSSQTGKRSMLLEREDKRSGSVSSAPIGNANAFTGTKKTPLLNEVQRNEAALVDRLPKDFPVDRWEEMNTKAQLKAVRFSGLNDQEQWILLNATTPLGTLSMLSNIERGLAAQTVSPREATALASAANRLAAEKQSLKSGDASILPPLQKNLLRGELEDKLNGLKAITDSLSSPASLPALPPTRSLPQLKPQMREKPMSTPMPDTSSKSGNLLKDAWNTLKAWVGGLFAPKETEPTPTSQLFVVETLPPTATPKTTPMPKPTSTPSPTPTPTPSERDFLANKGVVFAEQQIDKPYSNSGRTGSKGYDCSGLVKAMCDSIKSELPFDNVHIKTTCKYGMSQSFLDNPEYGEPIYKYKDGGTIKELQAGDLVFSAYPNNLKQDSHVSIATGELMYDSETGQYWPQVIEASKVTGTVTDIYPAFNEINDDGYYSRSHSNQIITYVIRPNYDWEEQP